MIVQRQRQIRYIKEGDPRNSTGATRASLIGGSLFPASTRIVELSVGAMVGFGFFVNDTPTPLRVLRYGDPTESSDAYSRHETFNFPQSVLNMAPIYNIKCEAASIDRLNEWNNNNSNNEEWLFISYTEEVNI